MEVLVTQLELMLPVVLAAMLAVAPVEPPRRFSVYRETVLLSGVAMSVAGTAIAGYSLWKAHEWSVVTASALVGAGSVISLGTAFGSHRWESPPGWVFFVGPVMGVLAGMLASFAYEGPR